MIIKDEKHLKSLTNYASTLLENQLETYEEEETNNAEDAKEALFFLQNFPKQNIAKEFNPHILPNFAGDFLIMAFEEHNENGDYSEIYGK